MKLNLLGFPCVFTLQTQPEFIGQGGMLTTPGMLFVNRCTWAHILDKIVLILGISRGQLRTAEERAALDGEVCPEGIIIPT